MAITGFSSEFSLTPLEERAEIAFKRGSLYIGIPKETSFQERRIALTPQAVELLVAKGHRVTIESGAGLGAHFSDREYAEVGADIVFDTKKVFEAQVILKTAPLTTAETDYLHPYQIIFSPLHLPTMSIDFLPALMQKQVTAIAYEYIKDEKNTFPIVRAASEIAGSTALLIAAEHLSNAQGGRGILLGGISGVAPAVVLVLGAGVVGEYVARTALGLGAEVRVFDNSISKLIRLQNHLGQRVYTSTIIPAVLKKELANADVAVGAIHAESGRTLCVVSEDMVEAMKPGSVIIDISIDQGGCFATSEVTSHQKPTFVKHDIIHYCVPNIASRVSKTASIAFSNVLTPLLLRAHEYGGFEKLLTNYRGARHGVYLYKGRLTNRFLAERFNLRYTDLDLLMATNF